MDWNNAFLLTARQASGNFVASPPDIAREIAQMGAATSDAVSAATGSTIASFACTGGSVTGADANIAAGTAAHTDKDRAAILKAPSRFVMNAPGQTNGKPATRVEHPSAVKLVT